MQVARHLHISHTSPGHCGRELDEATGVRLGTPHTEDREIFQQVHWAASNGDPVCTHCGGLNACETRRPNGSLRFRCKASRKFYHPLGTPCSPATSCRSVATSRPSRSSAMR